MYEIPKVILLIESSRSAGRDMLNGIAKYSWHHGPWAFYREPPSYIKLAGKSKLLSWIKSINCNGVIAHDHYASKCLPLIEKGIPVVLGGIDVKKFPNIPTFTDDGVKAGVMAAEYLLGLGFKNFAYYGLMKMVDFRDRGKSFADTIQKHGYETYFYKPMRRRRKKIWETELKELASWLSELPKPLGVFSYADDYSSQIAEACKIAKLRIPEEVAIIGVDDDAMVCNLSYPPLSSIAMNYEKAGYEVAELLDQAMSRKFTNDLNIIIEPSHVVTRQSTNIVMVSDPYVRKAISFIRENANRSIQVQEVVNYANISSRALQQKFNKSLGHSIRREIKQTRIDLICKLLLETNISINQIAMNLDHQSVEHISRYFKQEKGLTPLAYRKKYRKDHL